MRIIHLLCIFYFFSATAFAASEPFDVVFDLDWTLAYKTTAQQAAKNPDGIFVFENEYYRVPSQNIDALRRLHTTPGIRVSFNSGGTPERNQALIQFIYANINQGQSEISSPHMVLDKNDLIINDQAKPSDPFAVRFKKNLLAINSNLKRIILIDDIKNFLPSGQEANMLWTGTTFEDLLSFQESSEKRQRASEADQKYFPRTEAEYLKERNKIARLVDLVIKAFQQAPTQPVEVLNAWTRDRYGYHLDLTRGGARCESLF